MHPDTDFGLSTVFLVQFVKMPQRKSLGCRVAVFPHDEAGVSGQVIHRLGRTVLTQVGRGCHQHALVAGQPARDPVGCPLSLHRPQPDGAVKPIAGQIG